MPRSDEAQGQAKPRPRAATPPGAACPTKFEFFVNPSSADASPARTADLIDEDDQGSERSGTSFAATAFRRRAGFVGNPNTRDIPKA
jgi:hypothetical protein